VPVKLGFIILSIIGVLRIPEEFYLYKDKGNLNNTAPSIGTFAAATNITTGLFGLRQRSLAGTTTLDREWLCACVTGSFHFVNC